MKPRLLLFAFFNREGVELPAIPDFPTWTASELERSLVFRASVDRLRRHALGTERAGYPRSTGPLAELSWDELREWPRRWNQTRQSERARAWKKTLLATDEGLRHVREYVRGCEALAKRYLGSSALAPAVHELIGRDSYRLILPPIASGPPAPKAELASTLSAYLTGASWGAGATANRQAWYRHKSSSQVDFTPTRPQRFVFLR